MACYNHAFLEIVLKPLFLHSRSPYKASLFTLSQFPSPPEAGRKMSYGFGTLLA